jgi:predicted PurR-regulated permease PerM
MQVRQSLNLIIVPLLIIAGCSVGLVLVWAEDILVPFVISVFFTYLLRPMVDFLSQPISTWCCVLPARFRSKSDDDAAASDSAGQAMDETLNDNVELANLLEAGAGGVRVQASRLRRRARIRCGRFAGLQVPRWMAILLSMILVMALFVGLVVLVIDAMQSFENENLAAYEERTIELANIALRWVLRARATFRPQQQAPPLTPFSADG